jgi:hypothetical protein
MPARAFVAAALRWGRLASGGLLAVNVAACSLLSPSPPPAPPPPAVPAQAPMPPPAPAPPPETESKSQLELASAADLAARRLLDYHEHLWQMSPSEVTAEVARLGTQVSAADAPASPDVVLALALALAQEHNPGDLARAESLLQPLADGTSPETQPWQPMARLLAQTVAEQRRLEDLLDQQLVQRRDTARTIQQLTEKLEALKAIERSMAARPGAVQAPGSSVETVPPPKAP